MRNRALIGSVLRGAMPFPARFRRLKRRLSPYRDTAENSSYCLTNGLEQIAALRRAGVAQAGDVLEFGSGWLPLVPMLFWLNGARSVTMTDIEPLMDHRTQAHAKHLIAARLDEIAEALGRPADQLRRQLAGSFAPRYLVPWRADAHCSSSVDVIVSRAVLEHVPERALGGFLAQFSRILRPGGVMCHWIDNSDHWEHRDKSISRLDFLRYPKGLHWWLAGINQQHFQNRLRHSDYARLFASHGFTVLSADGVPDPAGLRALQTLPLAAHFRRYAPEDLAVLTSLFVIQKQQEANQAKPSHSTPDRPRRRPMAPARWG